MPVGSFVFDSVLLEIDLYGGQSTCSWTRNQDGNEAEPRPVASVH